MVSAVFHSPLEAAPAARGGDKPKAEIPALLHRRLPPTT
jgi:hypothetical protein